MVRLRPGGKSLLCGSLTCCAIALLVVAVVVEGLLLYQQRRVNRHVDAESGHLLTTFLHGDTAQVATGPSVAIRLQNVRFKWSEKVYVDAGNMAVRAVPIKGRVVDFDDLDSFYLTLQQSVVQIRPDVLEGMLNESVFNYPHSKIRDLKVTLGRRDGAPGVRLDGSVNLVLWIPFKMFTHLSVDRRTNTLVMDVANVKVFGVIPATFFIKKWKPLHLANIISLPPNKSLMVDGNRMMVKPFALFPPPRINGRLAAVVVDDRVIRLRFAGRPIAAPRAAARNYVYLRGGASRFGHFQMLDTDVLIRDQRPANVFVFSLLHYAEMIPRSRVEVHDTESVRVIVPDYHDGAAI